MVSISLDKRIVKRFSGFFGIVLTIFGWVVSNADHYRFVYRIFAPHYLEAISAFEKMHNKGFVLNMEDRGFLEISEILKEQIVGEGTPIISQIRTKTWGQGIFDSKAGTEWRDYIELEVSFLNSQPLSGQFSNLRIRIKERYLSQNLFKWSTYFFWIGIFISIASVLVGTRKKDIQTQESEKGNDE